MRPMLIQLMKRTTLLLAIFSLLVPTVSRTMSAQAKAADEGSENSAQYAMDWRGTGPTGGDVRALVFDPQDAQRLYFGTLDGQIYTSTNGGTSWRLLYNFNRPKLFLDNIIVDPRDSKIIYVAAHRHKDPGGFFKTTDGGFTWREAQELKGEAIHSLEQSPSNPNMLIVGTNNRVYKSMDSGDSWSPVSPFGTTAIESLAIDPRDANTIYAGTWYLPYKSTDGGQSWRSVKTGMIDDSDVFAIDIDPRNPNHIIASACSGIYDSRNSGEQWRKVQGIPSQSRRTRAILQHPSIAGLVFAGTTEGFWRSTNGGADGSWQLTTRRDLEINSIAVHPSNPQTIFIATNNYGVMVSRDAGKNFVPSNEGYSSRFTNFILPDRERPERVYATTINTATGGGFIFISNNGGASWEPAIRNITVNRLTVYSILQDRQDGNLIYLGTNYGIYRSTDRGGSWAPIGAPKIGPQKPASGRRRAGRSAASTRTSSAASSAARRSNDMTKRAQEALIAAGYDPGTPDGAAGTKTVAAIRKFQADKNIPVSGKLDDATLSALGLSGGVQTTTPAGKMPTPVVALTDAVNALAHTYDERNGRPGILAATNAGLYRTYDPMQGWEKLSYGPGMDPRTTAISVTAQNPKTIYVGTANSGVLVSRDGGETWEQVRGVPNQAPISSVEQDPKRSAYVYVGTKQSLYVSHDGGERWMRRGGNLPYGDYASILINPNNPDEIIVGNAWENGGGVYRSTDAGISWNRIDPSQPGLPSQRIWALAFDPRNQDKIFVGSHSAGIYIAERNGNSSASSVR